jgi:ankyrin repeat protein
MVAAGKGHVDVVKALLDAHAKPNLVDDHGRSALQRAAAASARPVVVLLLIRGAKPDGKSDDGTTPLFAAAAAGEAEIVGLLLDKRANPNPREKGSGETAFMRAADRGQVDVLRALLTKADVNAVNRRGETALMHAARNGRMQAVELLLANGAKLDARNVDGMTAAALARRSGQGFVADLLEKREALLRAAP